MTPKEKAVELVEKFFEPLLFGHSHMVNMITAKECAVICVDEIWQTISPTIDADEFSHHEN